MTDEEAGQLLDRYAELLKEHFDAVFIVASRDYPENEKMSQIMHRGRGNWFAQRGMLREVLDTENQRGLAYELARQMKDEP